MEKKIPIGTEVLIFNYVGAMGQHQDNFHFKKGVVNTCMELDELTTTQEVAKKRYYYSVIGEDGHTYYGNYGTGNVGSSVFRTKRDYKNFLAREIKRLEEESMLIERQIAYYSDIRDRLTKDTKTKAKDQKTK